MTCRSILRCTSHAVAEPGCGRVVLPARPILRKVSINSSVTGGYGGIVKSRPTSCVAAARPRVRQLGVFESTSIFSNY